MTDDPMTGTNPELAWLEAHIACDLCSTKVGATLQADGRFLCPADVQLLQALSRSAEDERRARLEGQPE